MCDVKSRTFVPEYALINGIEMFFNHYAEADKPVLLYLHGGPGDSNAAMTYRYADGLGGACTLVDWDQRGAGRTYLKNPDLAPDFDAMLADLAGAIAHLKARYGVEKIALLGHSWGSILGSVYALRRPEDISCYIGVGQVVSMRENETVGFAELRRRVIASGNKAHLRRLEKIGDYPGEDMLYALRNTLLPVRKLQRIYGLAFNPNFKEISKVMRSPVFRPSDLKALAGGERITASLDPMLASYDIRTYGSEYAVPVYYVIGEHDWQTPFTVARAYFDELAAPEKRYYSIRGAGHSTPCDQPERFCSALRDILARVSYAGCVSKAIHA